MGFFKELIDAFKEGIEEGKQELAEEKKQENIDNFNNRNTITTVPQEEKLGVALASPFRESVFLDWFSVF